MKLAAEAADSLGGPASGSDAGMDMATWMSAQAHYAEMIIGGGVGPSGHAP